MTAAELELAHYRAGQAFSALRKLVGPFRARWKKRRDAAAGAVAKAPAIRRVRDEPFSFIAAIFVSLGGFYEWHHAGWFVMAGALVLFDFVTDRG
jgi:hypothetical protein